MTVHPHRLFWFPESPGPGYYNCLCCDGRFRTAAQAGSSPCNALTVHATGVPGRDNPVLEKQPHALYLGYCGTQLAHMPKHHGVLPTQTVIDHGPPPILCRACHAELHDPQSAARWTPLR